MPVRSPDPQLAPAVWPTATEHAACVHCGDPCGSGRVTTEAGPFCCGGCASVHALLTARGLEAFYACEVPAGRPQRDADLRDPDRFLVLDDPAVRARVVAIGETGMDLYWPGKLDGCADPSAQRESFAWHIDLAKRTGKPLMIHNRDADAAVLDVLAAEGAPDTVIFHCFSSGPEMARTCVSQGWVLSLSGTVSFRNARDLREAAGLIPPEQLLVETDAPFLTPHPYRGAPNEPYCLPYTVRALAEVVDRPAELLAEQSCDTARRVYGL